MLKTLKRAFFEDHERCRAPRTVQQTIPIKRIWQDGIFLVSTEKSGRGKYAKSFKFSDINYALAGCDAKKSLFLNYSALLNSFDDAATTKITILLRKTRNSDLKNGAFIDCQQDNFDIFRKEYNQMLEKKLENTDVIKKCVPNGYHTKCGISA